MCFPGKGTGSYAYLQLAESYRQNGRVQQRVLSAVGWLDVLQASGQHDAHKAFTATGVALPPLREKL